MIRHSFAPFEPDAAHYLSERTGIDYTRTNFDTPHWLCVTARKQLPDQTYQPVVGVCCFEFRLWFDAYFTIAIDDRRAVSRRVMRAMFTAVFSQAKRITTEQPADSRLQSLAKRMGFQMEGYKRLAVEGRWDAFQLGMTADTCRYLQRAPRGPQEAHNEDYDGQHPEAS